MHVHIARPAVDHETVELQHRRLVLWRVGSAQDGPDPGRKLSGRERFDNVVVGAQLQTENAIHFVGPRCQEDHRYVCVLPEL